MSTYDIILDNVESVLHSLMERHDPEDYNNIGRLIEVLEAVRG